jgi:ubiquinone/menaquinone biosynthesis C-methylase UbiE
MPSHYHGCFRPFDDLERRKWQDPESILAQIGVKPGITFVDIGCGGGFFALPAGRMVGAKGKVYGLDASAAAIASIKEQAAREGLKNLELTVGRAEEVVVCQHCADIVFFGIALHDFQDPSQVLENAKIIIKPTGQLVDLDWKQEAAVGPPRHIRFDEVKASQLIEAAGYKTESIKESGRYHYLIIARLIRGKR